MEKVAPSLFRRDELLHMVAEKKRSDLVVVDDCREGKNCRYLSNLLPLGLDFGAEQSGTAHIDQKDDCKLPLLLEDLDEGGVHTGGDVPVHGTDIVSPLVLPHLAESHSPSLEGGMVLSGEYLVRERLGPDLYFPDLF